MTFTRLWQSFRACLILSNRARAEYLRKHKIYGAIGENCAIKRRKIPLYSHLIKMGNNVRIGSATFLTHDTTNLMLNRVPGLAETYGKFSERIGCIEIGDNVYIGSDATILYDTKIGSNVIIGTGSIVTHDIPDNCVVAGTPAKVIGTFEDYVARMKTSQYPAELNPRNKKVADELAAFMWEKFNKEHK